MEITGDHGADRVVDILGGDVTGKNIEASAKHGHIVLIGTLAGFHGGMALGRMLAKQLTLSASTLRGQPPEVKAAIADRLRRDIWPAIEADPPAAPRPALSACRGSRGPPRAGGPGVIGKIVLVTAFRVQLRPSDRNFNCEFVRRTTIFRVSSPSALRL